MTLQPTPALTFRTTGGILDLFFFLGPHPTDVVEQYTALVGRPFLPPFWSLGYHQCKFGYKNLAETNAVLRRTQRAGIPIDVQWNDLDYMDDRNDFTVDEKNFGGIKEFVDQLHDVSKETKTHLSMSQNMFVPNYVLVRTAGRNGRSNLPLPLLFVPSW